MSDLKAHANDFEGRFREVLSDPSNRHIPRVSEAGTLRGGRVVMHNGLLVTPDYYGEFSKILTLNRGVHEPQEERMFMEVLKHVDPGATMVELGSYWGFYSMWFQKEIKDSRTYLTEPDPERLEVGVRNFAANAMEGEFTQAAIGPDGLDFKQFLAARNITHLGVLHADIQGFELFLLEEIAELLEAKKSLICFCRHIARSYIFPACNGLRNVTISFWLLPILTTKLTAMMA